MNFDELLDKIKAIESSQEHYTNETFLKALRAVLKLHRPSRIDEDMTYCEGCSNSAFFPWKSCPTIKIIEKALE